MRKIKFGILSTAQIGINNVIPAILQSKNCEVVAICSRNLESASNVAKKLNIPKAYGSYEELLVDKEIDAIYNPLPNHLHIDWTIKAMDAGKHVLCEKPISIDVEDGKRLIQTLKKYPNLIFMEAFMYGFHKQWKKVGELICEGKIGEIIDVKSTFTYNNPNPENIRNKYKLGGGGLLDVGCYCINVSRMIYNDEPIEAFGILKFDEVFGVDVYAKATLKFPGGLASFSVGTQTVSSQQVQIVGTKGKINIENPFYGTPTLESDTKIHYTDDKYNTETFVIKGENQYMKMADHFAESIINQTIPRISYENSMGNMRVIDAVFASDKSGKWEKV